MRRSLILIGLALLVLSGFQWLPQAATPTPVPPQETPIPPAATPAPATASPIPPMVMPTPSRPAMVMPTASQSVTATIGQKIPVIIGYYTQVTPEQLKAMLETKDFVFINVHTPYAGEIANTDGFIPYDQLIKNLDKLPQDRNAKIVLYCRSGMMSTTGSESLVKLGYTNVFHLDGGMNAWQNYGYALLNNPK